MASVDSWPGRMHPAPVSKKPRRVDEPKATYPAKKSAKATPAPRKTGAGSAEFKRITDKLFSERKELLHKLAQ